MKLTQTRCPSCGDKLDFDFEQRIASCPFCENTFFIDEDWSLIELADSNEGDIKSKPSLRHVAERKKGQAGSKVERPSSSQPTRNTDSHHDAEPLNSGSAIPIGVAKRKPQTLQARWEQEITENGHAATSDTTQSTRKRPGMPLVGIVFFGLLAFGLSLTTLAFLVSLVFPKSSSRQVTQTPETVETETSKAVIVEMPESSSAFHDMHHRDAVKLLKNAGFSNIKTEEIHDQSYFYNWSKDSIGSVEKVTIGDRDEFDKGSQFSSNERVVIHYHTYSDENNRQMVKEYEREVGEGEVSSTEFKLVSGVVLDAMSYSEMLNYFINYYNSIAEHPFVKEGECATKDMDSGHHRPQYHLSGYSNWNNVVAYGTIDGFLAEFVTCGIDDCELYIEVPYDEADTVARVLPDVMRVFYDGIADNQIQGATDRLLEHVGFRSSGGRGSTRYYEFMDGANLTESQKTGSGYYSHRHSENEWIHEHGDEWQELWVRRRIPRVKP